MQQVRVLHILPSAHGYGAERQVVELLAGMRADDIASALLTIYHTDLTNIDALPFAMLSADRNGRTDKLFFPRLVREIRSFRPHIVHTHTHVGKYWGRAAAIVAGVPHIVHTEHNPCDPRRTRFERWADALLNPKTERVVTFFGEQATFLSSTDGWPREKFALIPNGLAFPIASDGTRAEARKALQLPNDRFAIFLIGRMEYQKNHALALEALAQMRPEVRARVLLCFAGSGEQESALRKQSHELDVDESVRFLGYRQDLRELLPGADLVLMTSRFEGMPLALIEAMSSSIPVLTTPWTGSRTMLGDGRYGFITRSFEPQDVARSVERAIEHPAARASVARNAYQFVQDSYGIGRMIAAHIDLYRDLCGVAS